MCRVHGLAEFEDALRERTPARRQPRRIQPLTWIVTAALMPVLLYDGWQTVRDVKQHHLARTRYVAVNLGSPRAARPDRNSD